MKQICDYCGGYVEDTEEYCPHCGGSNNHYQRQSVGTPHTIEELKQWYVEHNLPPEEVTRFFIGTDYREPKAFGIYKDGSRYIVYKNKDDGSRAIRYDGADEAYAVNELYLKLKERIAEQKARNANGASNSAAARKRADVNKKLYTSLFIFIAIFCVLIGVIQNQSNKKRGYYQYDGDQYYYLNDWYIYDNYTDTWSPTTVDTELSKNYSEYYESSSYDSTYNTSDFTDTSYYSDWEDSYNNSDWDSDSNWDSGSSWDSGGGDWGSDW